jgi:hypothetical protein
MDRLQVIGKPWNGCNSLENCGPAGSHWKTMDLLQVFGKLWTCCKSLENHGPATIIGKHAAGPWFSNDLQQVHGFPMTFSRFMVFQ